MSGTELATAYVSLVAETKGITAAVNTALGQAERQADVAGETMGARMSSGISGGLKDLGEMVLGGGALAAGISKIISLGNDFTSTLNTMQAVSSATAQQMAAVSERAKQLGNDISLPGTSAADAAAAMTELAKGGFSVEQSMQAAKGTLQLAAAAQISAADAATIQSQALQAFGKDADYAATAADVLANTANASSAEIGDVAQGLQQSGAVAHQFGLTMEDTATALGLFANSGIQGSDAGTLLKTALLALTDQGKPAQAAIEDLGLTVYDAQGKFVGLESLFGQLQTASKNMTPEMYQAATATLFGSDAARLAGVAAEQGAVGYDKMHTAIEKQGSAAEVANAKMKGLPGALSSVANSAENLALEVYQLVDGPLESFAKKSAEIITDVTPGIVGGFKAIGSVVGAIPGPLLAAGAAIAAIKVTGLDDVASKMSGKVTGAFRGFNDEMRVQQSLAAMNGQGIGRLGSAFATLEARSPALSGMATAYRGVSGAAGKFAQKQQALGLASGGVAGQLRFATASVVKFGGAAGGVAAAGARGLGSAVGALSSALGGPIVIGIAAATFAFAQMASASGRVKDSIANTRESVESMAAANDKLKQSLVDSNGLVNDSVNADAAAKIDLLRSSSERFANDAPGFWGAAGSGIAASLDLIDGHLDGTAVQSNTTASDMAADGQKIVDQMNKTGKSSSDLAQIITGSAQAFEEFRQAQVNAGSIEFANKLQQQRSEFVNSQQSASQMADAIQQIGDKAVSASEGVDALTNTLGKMRDDSRTAEDAQKSATLALDGFAKSATSGGFAALDAAGKIDLSTTAGVRLDDSMGRVATAWDEAGAAARTSAVEQGASAADAEKAASAAQAKVREEFIATAVQSGATQVQAQSLADLFLKWPATANTTVTADTNPARNSFQGLLAEMQGRSVTIDVLTRNINQPNASLSQPGGLADLYGRVGHKDGGRLPTSGPGTDVVDGILGVSDSGQAVARVNRGEWVVNGDSSEKYNRELAAINDGTFPKLPGFAGGGVVGAMTDIVKRRFPALTMTSGQRDTADYHGQGKAADFSNGSDDTPEEQGLAAFIADKYPDSLELIHQPFSRNIKNGSFVGDGLGVYGADTMAEHRNHVHWAMASAPTERADADPADPTAPEAPEQKDTRTDRDKVIDAIVAEGKRRKLPDKAITIAVATALVESDGAVLANANDPESLNIPHSGVGQDHDSAGPFQQRPSWGSVQDRMDPTKSAGLFYDELAKIDYQSMDAGAAAQAVQKSAVPGAYALRMQEAQQLAEESADREVQYSIGGKSSKSSRSSRIDSTPAPAAPGLQGSKTDDELQIRNMERAIREADQARNEVYDDATADQDARDAADDKLQQAINGLAETKKQQEEDRKNGKTKDGKQTPEAERVATPQEFASKSIDLFANAIKAGVVGQIDDAMGVAGLSSEPGALGGIIGLLTSYKLPQPNTDPQWISDLLEQLRIPAMGVFDEGGWLKPGEMAMNLGKTPEPIFNSPTQMAQFMGGIDIAPGAAAAAPDFSVHIHNPTFNDGNKMIRDATQIQSRQTMRYAGRPV